MHDEPGSEHLGKGAILWLDVSETYDDFYEKQEETYIHFGIFCLDIIHGQSTEHLYHVSKQFQDLIHPWNEFYPWTNYDGIQTEVVEDPSSAPYIFGSLRITDNLEEESLVLSLLQRFSSLQGPEIFIKVSGSDGEILLIESHDVLPNDYEYPKGNNRLWIHEGKFKFIPSSVAPGRGIERPETLDFLRSSYYKLIEIPEVSNKLHQRYVLDTPERYLKTLYLLPLELNNKQHANILQNKPRLIGSVIKCVYQEDFSPEPKKKIEECETQALTVLLPVSQCKLLCFYLQSLGVDLQSEQLPSLMGAIISKALQHLISKDDNFKSENSVSRSEGLGFQPQLINQGYLKEEVPYQKANMSALLVEAEAEVTEEDTMDRMQNMFSGIKSSLEKEDDSEQIHEVNDDNNVAANHEAHKFFREQNIDIDEDDFFEFFLTEALKVKKEDLDDYQSSSAPPFEKPRKKAAESEMINKLGDRLSAENQGDLDDEEALEELIEALKLDPSAFEHIQNILEDLDSE
ncbi:LAQU0S01e05952g1_1 [Lachancea quebecensis]|uniref:LAQU0S01e05952g1_1 n=1 Tax=Lachancea quebecensis TaxID=1654605 RepID=A0A0P1KLD1_9SACH|nr:LAQU0S01e05952g1_1 [Lachancea quebecensis]